MDVPNLAEHEVSEIIQMALCDHTSFSQIKMQYGLSDKQVKQLMRENLKPSSYRTWRTRVRKFSDRRESYK
ncbi:MAG: TIGR03643 family protein [Alphaproteobacteria bacterium]